MTMLASTSGINANRVRLMFRFWLDVAKDMQSDLADWLSSLKEQREMKPTILDALLLFYDLSQGGTEQLNRLFPFVLQATPVPSGERPTSRLNTPPKEITLDIKTGVAGGNGKQAMENFLSGMARLQGLDPAVYLSQPVISTSETINRIAGSEIALEVPTFDDLDLDLI